MGSSVLIPLISGLIGSIIGATASILAIYIQQTQQTKRERIKLACEMALAERNTQIEITMKNNKSAKVQPISLYQHYHIEILDALAKGDLTPEKIKLIKERNRILKQAISDV